MTTPRLIDGGIGFNHINTELGRGLITKTGLGERDVRRLAIQSDATALNAPITMSQTSNKTRKVVTSVDLGEGLVGWSTGLGGSISSTFWNNYTLVYLYTDTVDGLVHFRMTGTHPQSLLPAWEYSSNQINLFWLGKSLTFNEIDVVTRNAANNTLSVVWFSPGITHSPGTHTIYLGP